MKLPCQNCGVQNMEHKKLNHFEIEYKCSKCGNVRTRDLGAYMGWK